ncbi:MAG: hypothetical protein H0V80_17985 [Acidobacteria bacterium]|nr:hypothetical protein [Acidobacteriota bacterium]
MASDRRSFLLRVDPDLLAAVQRWASDDLRSVNGQVEFLLRRALTQAGRAPTRHATDATRAEGVEDAGDRGAE